MSKTRPTAHLTEAQLADLRTSPQRRELPDRRWSRRIKIFFPWRPAAGEALGALGRKVYVDAGFDPATRRVQEIFARGGSKVGEDIDTNLDRIANSLSVLLQIGTPLEKLAEDAPARLAHYLVGPAAPEKLQLAARIAIAAIIHAAIQLEAEENSP